MTLEGLLKWLADLAKRVTPFRSVPALKALLPILVDDVRGNFLGSHGPDGQPWAPLKWRVGRPLILTGRLMQQALEAVTNAHVGDGQLVAFLDDPFYAQFHQRGTATIPARPFFGISARAAEAMGDRIEREAVKFLVNEQPANIR